MALLLYTTSLFIVLHTVLIETIDIVPHVYITEYLNIISFLKK